MKKLLEKTLNYLNGYCERNPIKFLVPTISLALGMCFTLLFSEIKTESRYNEAWRTLTKLADTDKDGTLSLNEQAELSRRIGYEHPIIEGKDITEELFSYHDILERELVKIPKIRKAIESYMGEN
ncbi:hypothetical protein A3K73_02250 [Candidatus Pacearchaeota archaeon RBG_13_36_9]|nr:MAG: hypothetical protein A3K73_02250 [Candidatus Pacearchaeota archaeon RBG_13_36_9]